MYYTLMLGCVVAACYAAIRCKLANARTSTTPSTCYIGDLDDFLLTNILLRIPTAKLTTRCKLVSKRWNSLISTPFFVRWFIHVHCEEEPKPSAVFFYFKREWDTELRVRVGSADPIFDSRGFDLKFIPSYSTYPKKMILSLPSWFHPGAHILASYNDLFLCESIEGGKVYYICNPLTKHLVALPPHPQEHPNRDVIVGFVCEDTECRVVRIPRDQSSSSNSWVVEIFSNETMQWDEMVVLHPYNCAFKCSDLQNAFGCNGMLYWLTMNNYIIAYNPYTPEKCYFINEPKHRSYLHKHSNRLGVCQESLRLLQFHYSNLSLTLWKLEDYHTGKWNLLHQVFLKPIIAQDYPELLASATAFETLALYPGDIDNMVLLSFQLNDIYVCNLQKKTLDLVQGSMLKSHSTIGDLASDMFQLVLPCWPTSVPAVTFT